MRDSAGATTGAPAKVRPESKMPRIHVTPTTLKAAKSYGRPNGVASVSMTPNPIGVLALASVNGRGSYASFRGRAVKTKKAKPRSNQQENPMLSNLAKSKRAMKMAHARGISLGDAWKIVNGGKAKKKAASASKPAKRKATATKRRSVKARAWHGKRTGGKMASYRIFVKKSGRTKGHHVRNVTKAGVLGKGTLMLGAGRKRKTVHFSKFVSLGAQRGKGKRLKVYYKNAKTKAAGTAIPGSKRRSPGPPKSGHVATGIGSDRAQETMYDVGDSYKSFDSLRGVTDPVARRKLAAKLGKHKYTTKYETRTQKVKYRLPKRLGGFPVGSRRGRPVFVHKGRHISIGEWNEDPIPGYSSAFPDDPHVISRQAALKLARDVARTSAKQRAASQGTLLQKKIAKLEADRAKLDAKLAGLNPAEIDRLIDEGKYMYAPNKRGKRKPKKSGRRSSRRRSVKKVSLRKLRARLSKSRKPRKRKKTSARRRLRSNKRRSHRVRVVHMSANRRSRGKGRKHRKHKHSGMFRARRRIRRNYRRNGGLDMYTPSVQSALYVFGGFAFHKLLRGVLGGLIAKLLPVAIAPYGSVLSGLAVIAVGVPAAAKFVPAHGVEIGAGMVTSLLHDLFMALSGAFAPQAQHYLSGYGAIPSMNTTGYGFLSERGFSDYDVISDQYRGYGADPYSQAAAGYGAAPYSQAAAGYGEYEPMSGTLDGLHGDNQSIEAALNAADMPEQAAAGYGASPMQALAGGGGIPGVNTWIPNDPSLAINGFGGVF